MLTQLKKVHAGHMCFAQGRASAPDTRINATSHTAKSTDPERGSVSPVQVGSPSRMFDSRRTFGEERKFGGLDELLATIRSDIATASDELDTTPLAEAAFAPCLSTVGGAGMRLIDPDKLLEGVDPGLLSPGNSVSASREEVETAPPAGYEWGGTY